jgi:hypothetical protein
MYIKSPVSIWWYQIEKKRLCKSINDRFLIDYCKIKIVEYCNKIVVLSKKDSIYLWGITIHHIFYEQFTTSPVGVGIAQEFSH